MSIESSFVCECCCETNIVRSISAPIADVCIRLIFVSFFLSLWCRLLLSCLALLGLYFVRIGSLSAYCSFRGGSTCCWFPLWVCAFALLCSQLPMCVFGSRYNAHIIVIIYLAFVNRSYRKFIVTSICVRARMFKTVVDLLCVFFFSSFLSFCSRLFPTLIFTSLVHGLLLGSVAMLHVPVLIHSDTFLLLRRLSFCFGYGCVSESRLWSTVPLL